MAQMLAKTAPAAASYGQLPKPPSQGSAPGGFAAGISAVSMKLSLKYLRHLTHHLAELHCRD